MTYSYLRSEKITSTLKVLSQRISERFPSSSLATLSEQLIQLSEKASASSSQIKKPILWVRIVNMALITLIVLLVIAAFTAASDIPADEWHFFQVIFLIEAGINDIVLIGAGIFFLITIENRMKRRRSLDALHELRSIAHIIDMHQLTKDPENVLRRGASTASSPKPNLSLFELSRYLDYCSELLSLTGKIAAVHVQDFDDAVVLSSVTEIENLTTGLSRKIWQKLMIVNTELARLEVEEALERKRKTLAVDSNKYKYGKR